MLTQRRVRTKMRGVLNAGSARGEVEVANEQTGTGKTIEERKYRRDVRMRKKISNHRGTTDTYRRDNFNNFPRRGRDYPRDYATTIRSLLRSQWKVNYQPIAFGYGMAGGEASQLLATIDSMFAFISLTYKIIDLTFETGLRLRPKLQLLRRPGRQFLN